MRLALLLLAILFAHPMAGDSWARVPRACRQCRAVCGTAVSECVTATVASCPATPHGRAHRCRRRAKHLCRRTIDGCCTTSCRQTGEPICCGAPATTTTTLPGGGNPCFTDGGDGTVHDSCTGLQWEKKNGANGVHNPADLHNVNNVYPWAGVCTYGGANIFCQPDAAAAATCAALADGTTTDPEEGCSECPGGDYDPTSNPGGTGPCKPATGPPPVNTIWAWLNQLNAANFAGHNDWRIPSEAARNSCPPGEPNCTTTATPQELETILKGPAGSCSSTPCYYPIFGVPVSLQTWSASTSRADQRYAWLVNFFQGSNEQTPKNYLAASVRAVRTEH